MQAPTANWNLKHEKNDESVILKEKTVGKINCEEYENFIEAA